MVEDGVDGLKVVGVLAHGMGLFFFSCVPLEVDFVDSEPSTSTSLPFRQKKPERYLPPPIAFGLRKMPRRGEEEEEKKGFPPSWQKGELLAHGFFLVRPLAAPSAASLSAMGTPGPGGKELCGWKGQGGHGGSVREIRSCRKFDFRPGRRIRTVFSRGFFWGGEIKFLSDKGVPNGPPEFQPRAPAAPPWDSFRKEENMGKGGGSVWSALSQRRQPPLLPGIN